MNTNESPTCTWCKRQLDSSKRADAKFCDQRCRQSSHRFALRPSRVAARPDGPRRFAYADPPYPGCAHYYPERTEVRHGPLMRRLQLEYPDGWALSTSSSALLDVWCLCPDARLHIWVNRPRGKVRRRARSSFEAVLICLGRERRENVAEGLDDVLIDRARHNSFPGALVGMKPPGFCEWIFELLGAHPGDQLDDLYPGSGAVTEAWRRFTEPGRAAMRCVAPAGGSDE